MTIQHTVEGAGAPATVPPSRGAHYLDTTTGDQYLAKGTASVSDWVLQASRAALDSGLAGKVDKEAGKGLSSNDYTAAEKTKLAGLEGSHFKGTYVDLAALQTAYPTAAAGDYADVDAGAGSEVVRHLWDASDAAWKPQTSATTLTAAQVKSLYEANPDTNAYTDAEKAKLAGLGAAAAAVEPQVVVAQSMSPYVDRFTLSTLTQQAAVTTLPGAGGYRVAFNKAGTLLAVGSSSSPVLTVYNTSDWSIQPRPATMPAGGVVGLAFTPDDSKLIVISNTSPYLKIYNIADWSIRSLGTAPTNRPLGMAMDPTTKVRFAYGAMTTPFLTIRSASNGNEAVSITTPPASTVNCVAFSPDGMRLVAGLTYSAAQKLMVYDTSGFPVASLAGPTDLPSGDILSLCYSKDGLRLFVANSNSPYLSVYDTETWKRLPPFDAVPDSAVVGMALNADGRYLVTATTNGFVRIYDTDTLAFVRESSVSGSGYDVAVSPDVPATPDYLDGLSKRMGAAVLRVQRAQLEADQNLGFIVSMLEASNSAYASNFDVDASQFTGTWAVTTAWAASGNTQSLGSTNTADSTTSTATLSLTLAKPSWVKFDWKVDSEAAADFLTITINGVQVVNAAGLNQTGSLAPFEVPAGAFTLEATYAKDSSSAGGSDKAFIDNVKIISQP